MTTWDTTSEALHDAFVAADDHYQAELVRGYGVRKARDARYRKHHADAGLNAARATYHKAGDAYMDYRASLRTLEGRITATPGWQSV